MEQYDVIELEQSGLSLGASDWWKSTPHRWLYFKKNYFFYIFFCLLYQWIVLTLSTKKVIELLDAVTSVPYSRKGLGYTIGRGLDAVLPFTCYGNTPKTDHLLGLTVTDITEGHYKNNVTYNHLIVNSLRTEVFWETFRKCIPQKIGELKKIQKFFFFPRK
jgi:hypothetical protein